MELLLDNNWLLYIIVAIVSVTPNAMGVSAFLLVPLFTLYFGPKEGIAIITLYFIAQNIGEISIFSKKIEWNIAKKLLIWAIPGVVLGSIGLSFLPIDLFKTVLVLFLITYVFNNFKKITPEKIDTSKIPLFGTMYGFFSGLFGSGNLVKGPFFMASGLTKEAYIGTYSITSFFINIPKIAIYAGSGVLNTSTFLDTLPFMIIAIIGVCISKPIISRLSERVFNTCMQCVFFVSAALTLGFQFIKYLPLTFVSAAKNTISK